MTALSISVTLFPVHFSMSHWFYFDNNGTKQGPITTVQLKTLAQKGVVTSETLIETEQGKQAPAGKIRGLEFAPSVSIPLRMNSTSDNRISTEESFSTIVGFSLTNPFLVDHYIILCKIVYIVVIVLTCLSVVVGLANLQFDIDRFYAPDNPPASDLLIAYIVGGIVFSLCGLFVIFVTKVICEWIIYTIERQKEIKAIADKILNRQNEV